MLLGSEVKSLRVGQANIAEATARSREGGLWLINSYIAEYKGAALFQHEPRRKRKLLMHQREMHKIKLAIERKGMTLVPLEMYFNAKGVAKLKLGLAEGKKLHDKRETREEARLEPPEGAPDAGERLRLMARPDGASGQIGRRWPWPAPTDDGAAKHIIAGTRLPDVALVATRRRRGRTSRATRSARSCSSIR